MNALGLLVLALLDSVNPSAIVITLTLIAAGRPRLHVALYIASVFVSYSSFGLLALLGVESFLPSLGTMLRSRAGLIVQCLVGAGLLIFALTARPEPSPARQRRVGTSASALPLVLLGVSVSLMEMPTAVPYLAALAILSEQALTFREWAPLLYAYNSIFVLPLCLLLAGDVFVGGRCGERFKALRARLEKEARTTTLWILGLVGGWLVATGLIEYFARYGSATSWPDWLM